jgi:hypothetical protein
MKTPAVDDTVEALVALSLLLPAPLLLPLLFSISLRHCCCLCTPQSPSVYLLLLLPLHLLLSPIHGCYNPCSSTRLPIMRASGKSMHR